MAINYFYPVSEKVQNNSLIVYVLNQPSVWPKSELILIINLCSLEYEEIILCLGFPT